MTLGPVAGVLTPTAEQTRIESLDVLRGFALLGILLLNIVGFGMVSTAYGFPLEGMVGQFDIGVWIGVELFAEGAMRALFSILFGAGVVLFTTGEAAKGAALHYRRNFWLFVFGLFDAYVLLWSGDILVTYALAGAVLYWVRNVRPGRLYTTAGVLILLMSAMYGGVGFGLAQGKDAAAALAAADSSEQVSAVVLEGAAAWHEFVDDSTSTPEQRDQELAIRGGSYTSAFLWNVPQTNEILLFVLPMFLFWDALAFMLLGMAMYKSGILQGDRSVRFYTVMAAAGFAVGLSVNSLEVDRALAAELALLDTFAQAQPTYHIGRLGMACGYLALLVLLVKSQWWRGLRSRLASVGRMALTNYLMHSLICLFIFTGAGLGLVGSLSRAELYVVVVAIWLLQLIISPWWLSRYRYGPLEWLWRGLTYGSWPQLRRAEG